MFLHVRESSKPPHMLTRILFFCQNMEQLRPRSTLMIALLLWEISRSLLIEEIPGLDEREDYSI